MLRRFANALLRRRVPVVLGVALVTAWLGLTARGLGFDYSPQAVFETGDDDDRFLHEVTEAFGSGDGTILLIVARDEGVLHRPTLEWVRALTLRLRQEPWAKRVESLPTLRLPVPPKSDEDDLLVEPLGVDVTEARIAGDPVVDGLLVSRDRTATAIIVELQDDLRRVDAMKGPVERLDELARTFSLAEGQGVAPSGVAVAAGPGGPPAGARVQSYGLPTLRVRGIEMLRKDQRVMLPLVTALFAVALFLLFRGRPVAAVAPLMAVGATLLAIGGIMTLAGRPVDILSNVLPVMLFAIGVSDAVHLMARSAEESAAPTSDAPALVTSVERLTVACFMTSFTTAVGFASLLTSRTTVLRGFAWVAAVGVMIAYVFTILLVPTILSWVRPLRLPRTGPRRLPAALAALGASVGVHPWRWLAAAAVFAAVAGIGASQVLIDNRVHGPFRRDSELFRQQMEAEHALGGLLPLVVSIRAREPERLRDPDVLRRTWALQHDLEQRPGVGPTLSPATLVRSLWVAFQGQAPAGGDPLDDPNLPRTREELAQILLLGDLGGGLDWSRVVDEEWSWMRIVTRLEDRGSAHYLKMYEEVERDVARRFGDLTDIEVRLSGEGYVAARALDYFIWDLLDSLALAAVVIFGAMAVQLRSWRHAAVAVLPNAFPLLCTFGLMGFAEIPLNATTVVTFAIALGIAVDDTIHFLTRYDEERRAHADPREAMRRTMAGSGRPIVMTTLLLVAGMSVLLASEFLATRRFGGLLMTAIASALPGDLIVLPALLVLVDGRRFRRSRLTGPPAGPV